MSQSIKPTDSYVQTSVLERIGNTLMLVLKSIVPGQFARILLKLESENPTGSRKDRGNLVAALKLAKRLGPNATVVTLTRTSRKSYT